MSAAMGALKKNGFHQFSVGVKEGEAVALFNVLSHHDSQKH